MIEVEIRGVTARAFRTDRGVMVTEVHGDTELVFAESKDPDFVRAHFEILLMILMVR